MTTLEVLSEAQERSLVLSAHGDQPLSAFVISRSSVRIRLPAPCEIWLHRHSVDTFVILISL